jgi:ABC-type phosphate transport system permease subunit
MSEMAPILVFFAVSSGLCWLLVFKHSARDKFQRPAWQMYRLAKEDQRDAFDAMYLAGILVGALVFTICFFALVLSIR